MKKIITEGMLVKVKHLPEYTLEEKVEIISNDEKRTEARVAGSGGVRHTVILDRESEKERCTCTWFSSNQGERGACKHILAVKKLVQWKN